MRQHKAVVRLTSFCIYRVHGKFGEPKASIEVIAGGADARFTPEGKVQILASSAPFHTKSFAKRAPKVGHGFLALYGRRDALEELQFWRGQARKENAEFAYVDFEVQVGRIADTIVDRDDYLADPELGFMNISRLKSGAQDEIRATFASYIDRAGGRSGVSMSQVSQIATRPDLFDTLFEEDEAFKNVRLLVTRIADDEQPGKMRQIAYVRPGATIQLMQQGSDHVDVLLPSWVTDLKAAKEYQKPRAKAAA